jgi:Rieske Fe-S protein
LEDQPFLNKTTAAHEEQSDPQTTSISRRDMLSLMKLSGGALATATLFAACSFGGGDSASTNNNTASATATATTPAMGEATVAGTETTQTGNGILAQAMDVPVNSAKTFTIANQQNPGVLVHTADDNFVAFDSTCTHQQCPVAYNATSKLLECPCHSASFDPANNGAVVQGPADAPLTVIKITVGSDGAIKTA